MTAPRRPILIVDDQPESLARLEALLAAEGYDPLVAVDGREALRLAATADPEAVLLDWSMPDMDGLAVCRRLRSMPGLERVPIIFITAHADSDRIVQAFEAGAADYVTKPFERVVVLARLRTHLAMRDLLLEQEARAIYALDCNPLTRLPGNITIERRLDAALAAALPLCAVYVDLDNFKAFNDTYGFDAGSRVILYTAEVLSRVLAEREPEAGFVGHIGGDDYLFLCHAHQVEGVAEAILAAFEEGIGAFYRPEDLARGYIETKDRRGETRRYGTVTLSMGAVDLRRGAYAKAFQVSEACVEVKGVAKSMSGHAFFMDRRGTPPEPAATTPATASAATPAATPAGVRESFPTDG